MSREPLPTAEQDPHGYHRRYVVLHADETATDPQAEYFVLRLDADGAVTHVAASKKALAVYADAIEGEHPRLAVTIRTRHQIKSRRWRARWGVRHVRYWWAVYIARAVARDLAACGVGAGTPTCAEIKLCNAILAGYA